MKFSICNILNKVNPKAKWIVIIHHTEHLAAITPPASLAFISPWLLKSGIFHVSVHMVSICRLCLVHGVRDMGCYIIMRQYCESNPTDKVTSSKHWEMLSVSF